MVLNLTTVMEVATTTTTRDRHGESQLVVVDDVDGHLVVLVEETQACHPKRLVRMGGVGHFIRDVLHVQQAVEAKDVDRQQWKCLWPCTCTTNVLVNV